MSWNKTALLSTLAAGAILLSSGCTSKKDVAIAAKDDTIRRQETAMRSEQEARVAAENARLASDQNQRLAAEQARQTAELAKATQDQNNQLIERNALLAKQQADATNAMQAQLIALNSTINNMPRPAPNSVPGAEITQDSKTGSIHIRVAGSVLFDPGRAELRGSCADTLMKAASTIRSQYPNNAIRIEGHTDSTPVVHSKERYPDNMALSQARAAAVYEFLQKRGGISAGRMYTAGYGDRQPLVKPERTAADRARNRRVEIVILPSNLNVHKETIARTASSDKPKAYKASATTSDKPKVVAASAPVPADK